MMWQGGSDLLLMRGQRREAKASRCGGMSEFRNSARLLTINHPVKYKGPFQNIKTSKKWLMGTFDLHLQGTSLCHWLSSYNLLLH